MWIVSLPAQYGDGTWVVVPFGVALWLVAFAFEAIGDAQLARFTADSANRDAGWRPGCGATPGTPTILATCASGGDFLYWRAMIGRDL